MKKYCIIGVIATAVCLFVMNVKVVIAAGTAVLSAAAPLLLGVVIAYILNILLKNIEKIYFPKPLLAFYRDCLLVIGKKGKKKWHLQRDSNPCCRDENPVS